MAAKPCLLVVDDEPDLVQSLKDLLRHDYRVLGATRATEGLAILQSEDVPVVMSDQRMPEMTGVEFLAAVRERWPDAVRLLFTAYSDLQAVTDAINRGAVYRYITKPFQADDLRSALRQAFDHYELHAERRRLLRELQEKNRQLERANEELSQANELKRAFIKVASHELRTPLTIVCGLAELAASSGPAAPTQAWLDQIHRASLRLRQRVDQMSDLLHAENFRRDLTTAPVEVGQLVRGAAEEVRGFVAQRKQLLTVDAATDLGTIEIDAEKIHDAIVQLLVNAVKFTPDEGEIRLAVRRTPEAVDIAVADSGPGVDPAEAARLFDPFFTGFDVRHHRSGTFEHRRRGLGLGLSVAKAFVEMHGGTIDVASEVGKGTTFAIRLPARPTGETRAAENLRAARGS